MKRGSKYLDIYDKMKHGTKYLGADNNKSTEYTDEGDSNLEGSCDTRYVDADWSDSWYCWTREKLTGDGGVVPDICPSGSHNIGGTCWTNKFPWLSKGRASCDNDRDKLAGLCYKKCPRGMYHLQNVARPYACASKYQMSPAESETEPRGPPCIGGCITSYKNGCPAGYRFDAGYDGDRPCKPDNDDFCINKHGAGWKLNKHDNERTCVKCPGTPKCDYTPHKVLYPKPSTGGEPGSSSGWVEVTEYSPICTCDYRTQDGGPSIPESGNKYWTFSNKILRLDSLGNFYLGNNKLVYGQNYTWMRDRQLDIPGVGRIQFTDDLVNWAGFNGINYYNVNYTLNPPTVTSPPPTTPVPTTPPPTTPATIPIPAGGPTVPNKGYRKVWSFEPGILRGTISKTEVILDNYGRFYTQNYFKSGPGGLFELQPRFLSWDISSDKIALNYFSGQQNEKPARFEFNNDILLYVSVAPGTQAKGLPSMPTLVQI